MAEEATASRGSDSGQALLWSTICACIIVVLDVAVFALHALLASKSADLGPIFLISLAVLFAVGVLVGYTTRRAGVAAVAGMVAGILSTLVELVILLALIVLFFLLPPQHQGAGSGERGGFGQLGALFLGIFVLLVVLVVLFVFRLVMGIVLGALGALLGRAIIGPAAVTPDGLQGAPVGSPTSGSSPAWPEERDRDNGHPGWPPFQR